MQKKFRKTMGITMLMAGAALIAVPFIQGAMQGSISNGRLNRIDASALTIESVAGPSPVATRSAVPGATNFRDMSNNIVSASSGFSPFAGMFSSYPAPIVLQPDAPYPYYQDIGRDKFPQAEDSPVKLVKAEPVSTFSVDVDTASYSFVRRALNSGQPVPKDAVRVEELVNYFPYHYPLPETREDPFRASISVYPNPWRQGAKLVHIGIKGYDLAEKPRSNFVFLIDTSGSMNSPDKLPLVVASLKLLLRNLSPDDTVGIVTYAGGAGVALEPVKASEREEIENVLDRLGAGGSTWGAKGIEAAYDLALDAFIEGGNNRVILATDGDFNVGVSDADDLKELIAKKRDKGVFLSVLGYGMGNYQDTTMQALAQEGNGNAAYISDLSEAQKVLVQEASSTLFTIAKDVKLQVEFNPALVRDYRLVGYETRKLRKQDFNNDKVDAGDIGAGHTVTAIYDITPVGAKVAALVDDSRYTKAEEEEKPAADASNGEIAYLKMRFKQPDGVTSKLVTRPITMAEERPFDDQSDDVRFATAVAAFGQRLKNSSDEMGMDWSDIITMASEARGKDEFGYRTDFVKLARLAKSQEGKDE